MNYLWVIPFIKLKNLSETVCVMLYTLVKKMRRLERSDGLKSYSVAGEFL